MTSKVKAAPIELTQELLNELLTYDPETGKLYWKRRDRKWFTSNRSHNVWNARYAEKEAFTATKRGYKEGHVAGLWTAAHRVIWVMYHGYKPENIDHINGVRSDNRICNLRDVDKKGNGRNMKRFSTNSSGHTGVSLNKSLNKWAAYIRTDQGRVHLGVFSCINDAIEARAKAELELNYHPNHGRP